MNLVHNISPVKSKSEQEALRKASALSSQLHRFAMIQKCEDQSELALVARLNEFKNNLAIQEWAYSPLLSSGIRSTEVHAYPSSHLVASGELVLVDAGFKVEGWCSDITRTWPAGKHFSNKQKKVYNIVLDKFGNPLKLSEGMIFTVEPGLYFTDPAHSYYGIAVRIEDVVMVNDKTCEVLSSVPKEIEDIEELRSQAYF